MKYWNNEGKFSSLFEEIWEKYVPDSGECENKDAELVRAFGWINYDMGNNGAGNMFEDVLITPEEDDDWGEEYETGDLSNFYQDLFDKLGAVISYNSLVKLKSECRSLANGIIDFDEIVWIDRVGDELGEYIEKKGLI